MMEYLIRYYNNNNNNNNNILFFLLYNDHDGTPGNLVVHLIMFCSTPDSSTFMVRSLLRIVTALALQCLCCIMTRSRVVVSPTTRTVHHGGQPYPITKN